MTAQYIDQSVDISSYTVYADGFYAYNSWFTVASGGTMLLLGDNNTFQISTVVGPGPLRNLGTLQINGLSLKSHAFFANNGVVLQIADVTMGVSDAVDLDVIRNLANATWNISQASNIHLLYGPSRFVNLGLFEITSGGFSDIATIFNSPGEVLAASGQLRFVGSRTRFAGQVEGPGSVVANLAVLDPGADISVAAFNSGETIVHGDVVMSSVANIGTLFLRGGRLHLTGGASTTPTTVKGFGGVLSLEADTTLTRSYVYQANTIDNSALVTVVADSTGVAILDGFAPTQGQIVLNNLSGGEYLVDIKGTFSIEDAYQSNGGVLFNNYGALEAANGSTIISTLFHNNGVVDVGDAQTSSDALVDFDAAVTGTGAINISPGGVLDFRSGVSSGQTVSFTGPSTDARSDGQLDIYDLADFHALLGDFGVNAPNETVVVEGSYWTFDDFVAGGVGGSLMFSHGATQASIALAGQYDPSGFHISANSSGTTISYAPLT